MRSSVSTRSDRAEKPFSNRKKQPNFATHNIVGLLFH